MRYIICVIAFILFIPINLGSTTSVNVSTLLSNSEMRKIQLHDTNNQVGELSGAIEKLLKQEKIPPVLFLPKGTYLLKESIRINKPITLLGGDGCVIQLDKQRIDTNAFVIDSTSNVIIKNIKVIGAASELTKNNERSGIGISIEGSKEVTIQDVKIEHCWYGIRCSASKSNVRSSKIGIIGNRISTCIRNGLTLDGCTDVLIQKNVLTDNGIDNLEKLGKYPGYGIMIMNYQGKTEKITCINNVCSSNRGSGIGVWSFKIDAGPTAITITNNSCFNNRVHGIILATCSNSLVRENECYDNNRVLTSNPKYRPFTYSANGIHIEVASNNIIVEKNKCYETKKYDGTSEELQCAGIACGAGFPIDKEPAPQNIRLIGNLCANNKRFQKSVFGLPKYRFAARDIDGDAPLGRYKSRKIYRDERDNIELDSYSIVHLSANRYSIQ